MITSITTAGWVILGILAIVVFGAGFVFGERFGVKLTLYTQKVKGSIMFTVDEVLAEYKKLKNKF